MMGSGGVGGRRYQIAAVALTYAAVSMSAIPFLIANAIKENKGKAATSVTQPEGVNQTKPSAVTSPEVVRKESSEGSKMNFGYAIGVLVLLGFASPFLELASPISGLIGLVILFVGVRIAWNSAAGGKIQVSGPFKV